MAEDWKPWNKLNGESDEAYVRFLIYRNLGPARSVERARGVFVASSRKVRKGTKRYAGMSGQWKRDAAQCSWRERAAKWDAAQLASAVPETATTIFSLISETARVGLQEILQGHIKPKNWRELQEMVVILAGFISPEVITATIDHAEHAQAGAGDSAGASPR